MQPVEVAPMDLKIPFEGFKILTNPFVIAAGAFAAYLIFKK